MLAFCQGPLFWGRKTVLRRNLCDRVTSRRIVAPMKASLSGKSGLDNYNIPVQVSPKTNTSALRGFRELRGKIPDILYENLMQYKFDTPSPVQAHCIPILLSSKDVMACAQTGSGKTIMFLVPALAKILQTRRNNQTRSGNRTAQPEILVIAPTRELALQIHDEAKRLAAGTGLKTVCVYGGDSTRDQARKLSEGCDVMVATPGRLQMFIERRAVALRDVQFLIVDEADRMLDMGFEPQLQYIVRKLGYSTKRNSVMCSATFPEDMQYLAANFLNENYHFVTVGRVGSTTNLITQQLLWVEDNDKDKELIRLLQQRQDVDRRTLIFTNTKEKSQSVASLLKNKRFRIEEIHGDRSQQERKQALQRFKSGRTPILVATDLASRGLDVTGIDHVVQYDTAKDSDSYTHRIGRTGRGGEKGIATAFMNVRQKHSAAAILRQLRELGQVPPNWLIGMAHVAQREHETLVNSNTGSQETEEGEDAEFGGQDFRKTAKKGTWGAQKDLRFASFDEKAYEGGSDSGEETDFGETDVEASTDDEGLLEEDDEEEDEEAAELERRKLAIQNYSKPKPSAELLAALKQANLHLGSKEPIERVERHLNNKNKMLYYEYMAMFPPEVIETHQSRFKESNKGTKKILMVAEKPSVAEAIATILSRGRFRKRRGLGRNVPVFEFSTVFPATGERVLVRVTSVVGHVFSVMFNDEEETSNWRRDPGLLFNLNITKKVEETSDKLRIVEHIQNEASECSNLVLWLDCDREGENIAYEVISVTRDTFQSDNDIYRARFSALTNEEIGLAFKTLSRPNQNESMAVDARQELDLKVGVAFSRLITNSFGRVVREKFSQDIKLLSYGPCQTPTLFFCVDRYREMMAFERKPFWKIRAKANVGADIILKWSKGETFDETEARQIEGELNRNREGAVRSVKVNERRNGAPNGLNTVQLLMSCSKSLGVSPKKAMQVAEKLYTSGYVSYPRTETTQYPSSMNIMAVLNEHRNHPDWGKAVDFLTRNLGPKPKVPQGGVSVGDHPPITPTRYATRSQLAGLEWRVYEFITRHFIGSLMGDMHYREIISDVQVGSWSLVHKQIIVDRLGFGGAMTWTLGDLYKSDEEFRTDAEKNSRRQKDAQKLYEKDPVVIRKVEVVREETCPPQFLQEHELVSLMDKYGIGTDASMAGHISTIVDRNYVIVCDKEGEPIPVGRKPGSGGRKPAGGRYMVPTPLGISFIEGIAEVDDKLVLPEIRAMMEKEVSSIADGKLDKAEVMDKNINWFSQRFQVFRESMGRMDRQMRNILRPSRVHLRETRPFFPDAPSPKDVSKSQNPRRRGMPDDRRSGGPPSGRGGYQGRGGNPRGRGGGGKGGRPKGTPPPRLS